MELLYPYGHACGDQIVTARVIVCGSRRWNDRKIIAATLNALVLEHGWRFPDPIIVHGAARGADRLAHDEAGKAGLLVEPHPADWDRYGKRAGLIRNEEMAALGAVLCVAFWDGQSTGTKHMMDTAVKQRRKTKGQLLAATLEKGDRVVIIDRVRPAYLAGTEGVVDGFTRGYILVRVEDEDVVARFGNPMKMKATLLLRKD